jgi:hypothetical protein
VRTLITLSLNDGTVTGTQEIVSRRFGSAADEAAWQKRGSPPLPKVGATSTYRSGEPYYDTAAISTDPDALRRSLEDGSVAGYLPNDGQVFELVASLLVEPTLSSEQRTALFDVIASLDGVELLGTISDPLDRAGTGFSYQVGPDREILIFDSDSGQPLAFEEYSPAEATQMLQWQAFDPPAQ